MKPSIRKYFLLIIITGLLISCSKKSVVIPKDIIPMKQMVEVLTDVHLAEAAKDVAMSDDKMKHTIQDYYAFIYSKNHITKDQLQKSLAFYKSNPELMEEIYTEVISHLSELQAKPGNH